MNARTRTLTLAASALALTLTLAACGAEAPKAEPATTHSQAAQPDKPLETPTPTPEPEDEDAPLILTWGQEAKYDDGMTVAVSQPGGFAPSEYSLIEGAASYVAFTITVTNNTTTAYDPFAFQVSGTSGGVPMEQVFDSAQGMSSSPSAAVLPGQSVSWPVAFSAANTADLTLDVTPGYTQDYDAYGSAFYQGAAA